MLARHRPCIALRTFGVSGWGGLGSRGQGARASVWVAVLCVWHSMLGCEGHESMATCLLIRIQKP